MNQSSIILSEKDNSILQAMDKMLTSCRYSFVIARLLMEHVFYDADFDNKDTDKTIRRFLVLDFYQLLCIKSDLYCIELKDFSKKAEYHYGIQEKMKTINEITTKLDKKEFHDDIIYFMKMLS